MNTGIPPPLELIGLGVSFGQKVVLDGISFALAPDGIDVLMGPVKSGKSTLLRTLSGLFDGHSLHRSWGKVIIRGQPLSSENRPALVQQHAQVIDQSLLQTLLLPLRESESHSSSEWQKIGLECLVKFGLSDYLNQANSSVLQCPVQVQRGIQILAQALLKPNILMIDEPTYGLKEIEAIWMTDWLKQLSTHCKLWVVLHNQMQARRLADRIMLIGGGRLLAHQETLHFFNHPANEWVGQFIRTGGLTLPSPDARAQDLAEGVPLPPQLSDAAIEAVHSYSKQNVTNKINQESTTVAIGENAELRQDELAKAGLLERRLKAGSAKLPYTGPERRKLVEIPTSSRDGVELASAVGEYIFRDSSAPRGFHWILPGKLAGCPAPGVSAPIDYDLKLLAKVGITRLITLTENDLDQAALGRHHLSNTHLPIFDREAPSVGQTHMLLVRMQRFIEAGEVLAVHCKAGLGRTGTILAAWLIRDGGLSASDSIARLRRIEPGFIQSKEQEDFLYHYEDDLTKRLV